MNFNPVSVVADAENKSRAQAYHRVGRATARDALCRGFDPYRQRPRGVAVDYCPKQSGWLINQLGVPQFYHTESASVKLSPGLVSHPTHSPISLPLPTDGPCLACQAA
jgi:hypothetical protein